MLIAYKFKFLFQTLQSVFQTSKFTFVKASCRLVGTDVYKGDSLTKKWVIFGPIGPYVWAADAFKCLVHTEICRHFCSTSYI